MKREELMINDIVFDYTKTPVKVCAVGQDIVVKSSFGIGSLEPNELSPIPLTEEILVKNGFGKVNNQYFFGQVEIKELRDCWVVIINKEDADVDINIHYVHQLQRLLNLCNIDKEIIL